jgi:hypothetical protein
MIRRNRIIALFNIEKKNISEALSLSVRVREREQAVACMPMQIDLLKD